ncbi:immunoglobulin superfamily member 3-like, partial [Clarias magur]
GDDDEHLGSVVRLPRALQRLVPLCEPLGARGRRRLLHARLPRGVRAPVLGRSARQRAGHLRRGHVQEEDGVGRVRAEPGRGGPALPARHALQHPPAGVGAAVGLRRIHVQSRGGGGREQP